MERRPIKNLQTAFYNPAGSPLEHFKPPHHGAVRYFYILSSRLEPDVIKFGVGHEDTGSNGRWGGFARLRSYIHYFGINDVNDT